MGDDGELYEELGESRDGGGGPKGGKNKKRRVGKSLAKAKAATQKTREIQSLLTKKKKRAVAVGMDAELGIGYMPAKPAKKPKRGGPAAGGAGARRARGKAAKRKGAALEPPAAKRKKLAAGGGSGLPVSKPKRKRRPASASTSVETDLVDLLGPDASEAVAPAAPDRTVVVPAKPAQGGKRRKAAPGKRKAAKARAKPKAKPKRPGSGRSRSGKSASPPAGAAQKKPKGSLRKSVLKARAGSRSKSKSNPRQPKSSSRSQSSASLKPVTITGVLPPSPIPSRAASVPPSKRDSLTPSSETSPESTPSEGPKFAKGDIVQVDGLTQKASAPFNGKQGTIVRADPKLTKDGRKWAILFKLQTSNADGETEQSTKAFFVDESKITLVSRPGPPEVVSILSPSPHKAPPAPKPAAAPAPRPRSAPVARLPAPPAADRLVVRPKKKRRTIGQPASRSLSANSDSDPGARVVRRRRKRRGRSANARSVPDSRETASAPNPALRRTLTTPMPALEGLGPVVMNRSQSAPQTEDDLAALRNNPLYSNMPGLETVEEHGELPMPEESDSENLNISHTGFPRTPTKQPESKFGGEMAEQSRFIQSLMAPYNAMLREINENSSLSFARNKDLDSFPGHYKVGFAELKSYVEQSLETYNVQISPELIKSWRIHDLPELRLPYITANDPQQD